MKKYIIKLIIISTLLIANAYGVSNPEPMRMDALRINNNQSNDCSEQYNCDDCNKNYSCENYGAYCCDDATNKNSDLSCSDLEANNWDCSGCACSNHPEDQDNVDSEGNFISKFGCMDDGNHPGSNFPNGCTPGVDCIAACNYSDSFMYINFSRCDYPPPGDCDCEGKVLDDCGICGGPDKIYGALMDCCEDDIDDCDTCEGSNFFTGGLLPNGACDCEGNILDGCGQCGGGNYFDDTDALPDGSCDCNSVVGSDTTGDGIIDDYTPHILDECGVCNGDGIVVGTCDCNGNVEDCVGVCGGSAILDKCGVCNGDGTTCEEISGCTYPEAINYNSDATKDDGSCEYLMGDLDHSGTLNISDVIILANKILTGDWFSW